ncbi:hypothetical protein BBJ29_002745 [Phytophthora kernoviae]|uniref:Leucine-rich repeat-containing N-terminal plant-type domain-containing protein n=1 Tax=Phytophthora kernoviae TaxID=325452 RepID=A0A3F2RKV5_9STRA|nr:hypothetical protein BBJ29_002745 [Phytophthora kernoviae]RLN58952.1 hypothetical protein BBP00_00006752 [Phytophthora kernoviae]
MPSIIREFPSLMGIELWNATLVDWGMNAALSAKLHSELLFIYFAYVNMTALPDGILQPPLPYRLLDLEFIHTNLTTFPDKIASVWNKVEIVYIEHSPVKTFPSVFMQLPELSELSLIDNNIETIPDNVLLTMASNFLYNLAFSRNPLKTLPRAARRDLTVSYLALEFTQLTELPANITKLPDIARCGGIDGEWDPLGDERFPIQLVQPHRLLDA